MINAIFVLAFLQFSISICALSHQRECSNGDCSAVEDVQSLLQAKAKTFVMDAGVGAKKTLSLQQLESMSTLVFNERNLTLLTETLLPGLFHATEEAQDEPCDLCAGPQWLFIVSTGRAGSTSILAMLNAIPGYHIAGETRKGQDRGALPILHELYMTAKRNGFEAENGSRAHSAISEQKLLCSLQSYVKDLLGTYDSRKTKVVGIKALIDAADIKDAGTLDFLVELFPCARHIINMRRNISAQSKSAYHKELRHGLQYLSESAKMINMWQARHNFSSFPMMLEDFSVDLFNDMLTWLHVENCRFSKVCHANRNGGYSHDSETAVCN